MTYHVPVIVLFKNVSIVLSVSFSYAVLRGK